MENELKMRECEFLNAREFTEMFMSVYSGTKMDEERLNTDLATIYEVENFLNVWLGNLSDPECRDDDCRCCKCDNDDNYELHLSRCGEDDDIADCNFGAFIREISFLPKILKITKLYDIVCQALQDLSSNTPRTEYKIFGPESLCFCGKCERIDLENLGSVIISKLAEIVEFADEYGKPKREVIVKLAKFSNNGLDLENVMKLTKMIAGATCEIPDGGLVYYDSLAKNLVKHYPNKTKIVNTYCNIPDLEDIVISYGKSFLNLERFALLKEASNFIGSKCYPNSTIDAILHTNKIELVSYKSPRATVLDNSTNHLMYVGMPMSEYDIALFLRNKHNMNSEYTALNAVYNLLPANRPQHKMTRNNRYLSIISQGSFMIPIGGLALNNITLSLPFDEKMTTVQSMTERINGFPLRFGDETSEALLNLAMTCGKNNMIGFSGWESTPKIIKNGIFYNAANTSDIAAAKSLLLDKRYHPKEESGYAADNVQFLAKNRNGGAKSVLTLHRESPDYIWEELVANIRIDTPSSSRARPQLGLMRTRNGVIYPLMAFPLKLRLEAGFKPENYM